MKKNVILITVDCLRADHLSSYGYHRKTTPNIDNIAAQGRQFTNAFANGPFTSASFISILASAYPLDFKAMLPLDRNATLISEILKREGISTAAINSNPYLSGYYGYNRGWTFFNDFNTREEKRKIINPKFFAITKYLPKKLLNLMYLLAIKLFAKNIAYVDAEKVTREAMDWVEKHSGNPFFLWMHYMDLHEPYYIDNKNICLEFTNKLGILDQLQVLNPNSERNRKDPSRIIDIYDDKLKFVDGNIGAFIDLLSRLKLVDDTLVIITSDHGQAFFEHGEFGHFAKFYNENIRIPLILSQNNGVQNTGIELVSHIDIAPTILAFYCLASNPNYLGKDLLSVLPERSVISETAHNQQGIYIVHDVIHEVPLMTYAIITDTWKFILNEFSDTGTNELYNIAEDPGERRNLVDIHPEIAADLKDRLLNHIKGQEKLKIKYSTRLKTFSRRI